MNRRTTVLLLVAVAAFFLIKQVMNRRDYSVGMELLQPELTQAREEDKYIMLLFTGSDWCTWCIKLEHEVLDSEVFRTFAEKELILVTVDFPQNSSNQSEALKKRNRTLSKAYAVNGYPTVLLLDSSGELIGITGYKEGGPSAYIEHLQQLLANK